MNKIQKFLVASAAGALMFGSLAVGAFAAGPWNLTGNNTVTAIYNSVPYNYTVTFNQSGTVLTGFLTDPYVPPSGITHPVNGTVTGDSVNFTFDYGSAPWGVRTYVGTIDASGNVSGTWSDNGGDGQSGTWTLGSPATSVGVCPVGTTQSQAPVQTLSVSSQSTTGTNSTALTNGSKYVFVAIGDWINRGDNNQRADAEFATTDNWASHVDGYDDSTYHLGAGEFDLQINNLFVDWGSYNSNHVYSYNMTGAGSSVNFRVFDGYSDTNTVVPDWYGDNSGNLSVDIYSCTQNPTPTPTPTGAQCKNNGWKTLNDGHGHTFKNQGDCVSFFATGGKNLGAGQ